MRCYCCDVPLGLRPFEDPKISMRFYCAACTDVIFSSIKKPKDPLFADEADIDPDTDTIELELEDDFLFGEEDHIAIDDSAIGDGDED